MSKKQGTLTTIDHSKHLKAMNQDASKTKATNIGTITLPNVSLVNEQGTDIALFGELIKNKIVVMNTIFTTCTTVCPLMGYQFSRLQKVLQTQFSKDEIVENIVLLSISIDPGVDTPQRLASWKAKFDGDPGWTLLTGSQANVNKLLKAAGLFAADPEEHTPMTLIGDAEKNNWVRVSGLGTSQQLLQLVNDFYPPKSAKVSIVRP